jgi:hypothetical protein
LPRIILNAALQIVRETESRLMGSFGESPHALVFQRRDKLPLERFVYVVLRLLQGSQRDLQIPMELFVRSTKALRDTRHGRTRRGTDLFAVFEVSNNVRAISNFNQLVPELHGKLPAHKLSIALEGHGRGKRTKRANPSNPTNPSNRSTRRTRRTRST